MLPAAVLVLLALGSTAVDQAAADRQLVYVTVVSVAGGRHVRQTYTTTSHYIYIDISIYIYGHAPVCLSVGLYNVSFIWFDQSMYIQPQINWKF